MTDNIPSHINHYISSLQEPKRTDMQQLHQFIMGLLPKCPLWFLDGKDETGKIVANPNIGYGLYKITYAGGKTKDFYQIGLSANTSGISIYIMGIKDRTYLAETFGKSIGKASISGYCIKFKRLNDIHTDVLAAAIKYGIASTKA